MSKSLDDIGPIPVEFHALSNSIGNYKAPKDKITKLEKSGKYIRLKKGLYVLSPEFSKSNLSKELIANHLMGPSYLSMESALSYYGLIPERVFSTRSATTKRSKKFLREKRKNALDFVQESLFESDNKNHYEWSLENNLLHQLSDLLEESDVRHASLSDRFSNFDFSESMIRENESDYKISAYCSKRGEL